MKRLCLRLIPTLLTVLLAACSSAKPTFALIGVPEQLSYTDSANLLIDNGKCTYVIYRGNSVTPPEVVTPCTLTKDQKDPLGNPHWHVNIEFNTPKGPKTLRLTSTGKNNETAQTVPDVGVYIPKDWAQAQPAPKLLIQSTDAGSFYSKMAIHIGGVRCFLSLTADANGDTATTMPCGLATWTDTSLTVVIPGARVSSAYTGRGWALNFIKDKKSGNWKMVKIPAGFPTGYDVSPDTNFTFPTNKPAPAAATATVPASASSAASAAATKGAK